MYTKSWQNLSLVSDDSLQRPDQVLQITQMAKAIKNSTVAVILLILGIALPWFAHRFGIGMSLLPLHLPLIIGTLLLPLGYAALLAIMIPLLSTVLIGMPVFFPILPIIIIEFMLYVLAIKYFYQLKHYNFFISLLISLLLGRVAVTVAALFFGVFTYSGLNAAVDYFVQLFSDFVPGIIIQLLVGLILTLCFSARISQLKK